MMRIYAKNNSDNVTRYITFHFMVKFLKCQTYAFSLGRLLRIFSEKLN